MSAQGGDSRNDGGQPRENLLHVLVTDGLRVEPKLLFEYLPEAAQVLDFGHVEVSFLDDHLEDRFQDIAGRRNRLIRVAINILDGVEGIHFCHFSDGDVVRHALVQRIVRAYESQKPQQQELPLGVGEPIDVGVGDQGRDEVQQAQAVQAPKPQ